MSWKVATVIWKARTLSESVHKSAANVPGEVVPFMSNYILRFSVPFQDKWWIEVGHVTDIS